MKQERRSKVLFIVNTLMLIMLFAIPVYAYWGGSISELSKDDNETVEIGEGQDVITTVKLTKEVAGGKLVPSGRKVEATDVEEVVLTFDVLWTDEDAASHGAVGELTITTSFEEGNPANLLNVVVNGDGEIIAGTAQTITLTITLDEPANLAEYELVAGKIFTLAITFSVEVE